MGKVLKPVQKERPVERFSGLSAAQSGKTSIARALQLPIWTTVALISNCYWCRLLPGRRGLAPGILGRAPSFFIAFKASLTARNRSFKGVLTFFATAGSKNSRAVARITACGWQQPYHHLNKRKTNPQQTEIRMPLNWRPVRFSNLRHAVAHSWSSSSPPSTSSLSYFATSCRASTKSPLITASRRARYRCVIGVRFFRGGLVRPAYMRAAFRIDSIPVISTSVVLRMNGQSSEETMRNVLRWR